MQQLLTLTPYKLTLQRSSVIGFLPSCCDYVRMSKRPNVISFLRSCEVKQEQVKRENKTKTMSPFMWDSV